MCMTTLTGRKAHYKTDWACGWETMAGSSYVIALNTSCGRILNLGATRCLLCDMIVCLTKPLCDFHLFSPRTSYQGHVHAKAGGVFAGRGPREFGVE